VNHPCESHIPARPYQKIRVQPQTLMARCRAAALAGDKNGDLCCASLQDLWRNWIVILSAIEVIKQVKTRYFVLWIKQIESP